MGTPTEFDVSTEVASSGVLVVTVCGELDMSSADEVANAISAVPGVERAIVDLTACTFLDSAGVRLLLTTHRRLVPTGGGVEIVASDASVLRVLEITNVTSTLPLHSTVAAAL